MSAKIITQIIIFILIGLIIIGGIHFFIYYSLINFFQIKSSAIKITLIGVLSFLSVSYFISSFLSRYFDNFAIRNFYLASGLWLGLALNLLMAISLTWLIILFSRFLGFEASKSVISAIFIIMTLGFFVYGILNAFNLKIKNLNVPIKNLPAAWQDKTAVQISDIHLGQVHNQKFWEMTLEKIKALNPHIVFITGDLFDSVGDDFEYIVAPLKEISAPWGIYFIKGNHETYMNFEKVAPTLERARVKILKDEIVELEGVQIIGADYASFDKPKKIDKNLLEKIEPEKPSILLYHEPTNIKEVKEKGINLQLSGHIHQGQIFPIGLISRLIFKKYYHGFHQEGDFSIYTTSGVGTWGPLMRTASTPEIVNLRFLVK